VGVLHTLMQTYLGIGLFDVGMPDYVFAHHGNDSVHHLPFLSTERNAHRHNGQQYHQFLHNGCDD
jgi:hypothetical protein